MGRDCASDAAVVGAGRKLCFGNGHDEDPEREISRRQRLSTADDSTEMVVPRPTWARGLASGVWVAILHKAADSSTPYRKAARPSRRVPWNSQGQIAQW